MLSNTEIKEYLHIKKQLKSEKYQIWLMLILLIISVSFSFKYKDLAIGFLLPAIIVAFSLLYRGNTHRLLRIADNLISMEHQHIIQISKLNDQL